MTLHELEMQLRAHPDYPKWWSQALANRIEYYRRNKGAINKRKKQESHKQEHRRNVGSWTPTKTSSSRLIKRSQEVGCENT